MRRRVAAWGAALCLLLCACGAAAEPVPIYDLQRAMLAADDTLPAMLTVNSNSEDAAQLFTYFSDLDYSKVEGYFLAYSEAGDADEIAVIAVKNASDVSEAERTLKNHAQDRVNLYSFYEPDQAKRAEGAVIFTQGRCAALIISEKAGAVREALQQTLSPESK